MAGTPALNQVAEQDTRAGHAGLSTDPRYGLTDDQGRTVTDLRRAAGGGW